MIKLEKQGFLVVPSIRDVKYLKYTLESECREVLLSNAHIGNLKQLTENCHRNGQKVIVNHELIGISLIDSDSVEMALRSLIGVNFTAVELRPYSHAVEFLPMFKEIFTGKFFAGGFINSEERIKICQKAGFDGVMTSTKKLWSYIE